MRSRAFLQVEGDVHSTDSPREDTQGPDMFVSLIGALYVIVNSPKGKGKVLKEHILKDIVPRGFDARIAKIQEEHELAITDRDNQIQAIQYESVGLQDEI